jgi:hypothetical protein
VSLTHSYLIAFSCLFLQLFKSLIESETPEFVSSYVPEMLEVAIRAINIVAGPDPALTKQGRLFGVILTTLKQYSEFAVCVEIVKELGAAVIDLIERKTEPAMFMHAYAHTQKLLSNKRQGKKQLLAMQAVTNPAAFARRKVCSQNVQVKLIQP